MSESFDELVRDTAALHLRVLSAYRHEARIPVPRVDPAESIDLLLARVERSVHRQRSNGLPYATDPDVVMDELIRASEDLLVQVERARAMTQDEGGEGP